MYSLNSSANESRLPPTDMTSQNLDDLIATENRFQSHLKEGEYTVIAPIKMNEFENFLVLANRYFVSTTVHELLSNKLQIRSLLSALPANIKLDIYVMENRDEQLLGRTELRDYITRNNIDFKI